MRMTHWIAIIALALMGCGQKALAGGALNWNPKEVPETRFVVDGYDVRAQTQLGVPEEGGYQDFWNRVVVLLPRSRLLIGIQKGEEWQSINICQVHRGQARPACRPDTDPAHRDLLDNVIWDYQHLGTEFPGS